MTDKPVVVCLCGSTRFKEEYTKAARDETLAGKIVLTVGLFGHHEGLDMDGPTKMMLDALHLSKIDLADEVLIISKDGYIGQSTRSEIEYSMRSEKVVRWMEASAKERFYALGQGGTEIGGNQGQDEGSPRRQGGAPAD